MARLFPERMRAFVQTSRRAHVSVEGLGTRGWIRQRAGPPVAAGAGKIDALVTHRSHWGLTRSGPARKNAGGLGDARRRRRQVSRTLIVLNVNDAGCVDG